MVNVPPVASFDKVASQYKTLEMSVNIIFAKHALLPTGWASDVLLRCDAQGVLIDVQEMYRKELVPSNASRIEGPLLPGMPNLHSHAFQRAFAGLSEYRNPKLAEDSFWSWRALMYQFANNISPEQLTAIARALYVEMLQAGYTSVCEFHYLHNRSDGTPYADDTVLSASLIEAASQVGIGLTLLPVLYETSSFGGLAPTQAQRRFISDADKLLKLVQHLKPMCEYYSGKVGVAPHSLRAVRPQSLHQLINELSCIDAHAPVHIHIAEQTAEVQACLQWSGQRPVEWLLNNVSLDKRWCLVHATHMTPKESARAANCGVVAGICPTTEANLGDGIFDASKWLESAGAWGIGSDSHVCVNAAEEIMQFEYSQRLSSRRRNLLATEREPNVATAMTLAAVAGGAQASARAVAGLAIGQRLDAVALDANHPTLCGLPTPQSMLSAHVFASHRQSAVDSVWVGGKRIVNEGRHVLSETSAKEFIDVRRRLLN